MANRDLVLCEAQEAWLPRACLSETKIPQFLGRGTFGTVLTVELPSGKSVAVIMYQLAVGVNYFHSAGVVHRDLKPENILIDVERLRIQIADFGTARTVGDWTTPYVQARPYRSPEMILKNYGSATDIWSLGCILAELLIGQVYLHGTSNGHQFARICSVVGFPSLGTLDQLLAGSGHTSAERAEIRSSVISESLKAGRPELDDFEQRYTRLQDGHLTRLLRRMLVFDPRLRLTAAQLLDDEIFSAILKPDGKPIRTDEHRAYFEKTHEGDALLINEDPNLDWTKLVTDYARAFVPRIISYDPVVPA